MDRNQTPQFHGYRPGDEGMERARTQIANPFDYFDIDLTLAGVDQIFNISGEFIYFDTATTGVATMELNSQQTARKAPFRVNSGFALEASFKQLKISWSAQPGLILRIMYSSDARVIPALTGTLAISGTIATLEDGYSYGASYKSTTEMGANTPDTIFAPGANVNGALVYDASFVSGNGGAGGVNLDVTIVAKTSAPANPLDGDVILAPSGQVVNATFSGPTAKLVNRVKIAAGKGLYFISGPAENSSARSVLYTLL